jgi:hypothetical protein
VLPACEIRCAIDDQASRRQDHQPCKHVLALWLGVRAVV